MLKMRAPENSTGINIGGRPIEVGEDGSAQVHPADVAAAGAHGFTPWSVPALDPDKMTRAELIEHMVSVARREMASASEDELRSAVKSRMERDQEGFQPRRPTPPPGSTPAGPISADEAQALRFKLPGMPRGEMQTFLKSRNVAFGPATGDEKLRDMVSAEITHSAAQE